MSTYAPGLSLCMIVRDEERFLDDALRSMQGVADEICVVDTGSSDRTVEIARAHGARIRHIAWDDDFSQARNAALAMATRRWIVVLDADERLDPGSRAALAAVGRTRAGGRGKWVTCRNLTDGHDRSGAMTNALVRVFPNDPRIRYRNPIHEFVTQDGGDGGLPSDTTTIGIVHHGYLNDVVIARCKGERNLRLSRCAVQSNPDDPFHHYNLGMASLLASDNDGAIVALERARDLTRNSPRGYRANLLVVLADLYAGHRGDLATARGLVAECLEHVPHYSNAHFTLGKILVRGGRLFEARDAFGRAIAAGVHDAAQFVVDNEIAIWKAHNEIGATLMIEHRFAEALAWFELAASARPEVAALTLNRARCHEALGAMHAAATLFEAAFGQNHDEQCASEWINFLLRRNRCADALAAIDAALPLVEAQGRTVFLGIAAAVHFRAGNRDRAQSAIDRALMDNAAGRSRAIVEALAAQLGMNELCALLPAPVQMRAKGVSIAYALQA